MTFDSAKELFEAGKFSEAKQEFEALLAATDDQKKLKMWIRKCDSHLSDATASTASGPITAVPAASTQEQEAGPVTAAPVAVQKAPQDKPAVRHDWMQTNTNVIITLFVKNRSESDVTVEVKDQEIDVSIKLNEGKEFNYNFAPLFATVEVDPKFIEIVVKSMKVEIKVQKAQPNFQWAALESVGGGPATIAASATAAAPATQHDLPVPNSKGKDWNKVKIDDEDDKLEGEAATNKFFKDIYGGGTDEQRRAMMKSFQESNGTVLSTNWADVGKRDVKCEAPKGMEVKKWEQ